MRLGSRRDDEHADLIWPRQSLRRRRVRPWRVERSCRTDGTADYRPRSRACSMRPDEFLDRRDADWRSTLSAGALALAPDHPEVCASRPSARVLARASGRSRRCAPPRARVATGRCAAPQQSRQRAQRVGGHRAVRSRLSGVPRRSRPRSPRPGTTSARRSKPTRESAGGGRSARRARSRWRRGTLPRVSSTRDNLKALGRIDEAAAAYRAALAADAGAAHAWWGLANLKTVRFERGGNGGAWNAAFARTNPAPIAGARFRARQGARGSGSLSRSVRRAE